MVIEAFLIVDYTISVLNKIYDHVSIFENMGVVVARPHLHYGRGFAFSSGGPLVFLTERRPAK